MRIAKNAMSARNAKTFFKHRMYTCIFDRIKSLLYGKRRISFA